MQIGQSARLYLAASLLLPLLWLRPAAAQLLGPEFQANSYTTSSQKHAGVATGLAGSFVVVWDSPQDGSAAGVFGQRFTSSGSRVGSEFQVNTLTTQNQLDPAIASFGIADFVVVWTGDSPFGSAADVYGQRFNSSGARLGSEFQVNTYEFHNQYEPDVAAVTGGRFVVVWTSYIQDGSGAGVFGQVFDGSGSSVGSEFQVNTYTTSNQRFPAVAGLGSDNFIVVWSSWQQDSSSYEIFGQQFNFTGTAVGSEFRINSFTPDHQRHPAVARDGVGGFVVAWESWGQDGSGAGVFAQRVNSSGSNLGPEFRVNTYTTHNQGNRGPAIAADGTGNFVVTWDSFGQDGSYIGVFGQRFHAGGARAGSEFQVNTYTTLYQGLSTVAADGAGNFVVAWESYGQDGSDYGVFGRRLVGPVFAGDFESAPPFWSATTASMCSGNCGSSSPGGCWCDVLCLENHDCCIDACTTCGLCLP